MKRFLIFVIICIVTLSLGLTTYYLLMDNETININSSYFEVNKGETFAIDIEHINPNPKTKIYFESLQPDILYYDSVTNLFYTISGGRAIVKITSNKADFKEVTIEVIVGDGSENAPYFIKSVEDLLLIGKPAIYDLAGNQTLKTFPYDKAYKLTSDLDLRQLTNLDTQLMEVNSVPTMVYEKGIWLPIGYDAAEGEGFSGTFDFNNHTISNMSIIEDDFTEGFTLNNAGLFAKVESGGKVTGLNLSNATIEGSFENIGAITAVNYGRVERSKVVDTNINSTASNSYVGGVVGVQEVNSNVVPYTEMVYTNATISGNDFIGGIVGHNKGGVVVSSYTDASLQGELSASVGGIVGLNEYKEYENTLNKGNIKDTYFYGTMADAVTQGAIIGQNINKDDETSLNIIRGNYYSKEISGDIEAIGGLLNSNIDTEKIGVFNKTIEALKIKETYFSYENNVGDLTYWSFIKTWSMENSINDGLPTLNMDGTKVNHNFANINDGVSIYDISDLYAIENNMSGVYVLKGDIDLSAQHEDWLPIGYYEEGERIVPFNGTFIAEGDFKISNLKIESSSNVYSLAGLFAELGENAVIKNITFENVNIEYGHTVGALAGKNKGYVEGVKVINTIEDYSITAYNSSGESNVGAIVGINDATITNSYSNAKVIVNSSSNKQGNGGGIAGLNKGTIENSYSQSEILSTGLNAKYIGGLAGYTTGSITSSHYLGNITVDVASNKTYIGGLTGYLDIDASIKSSYTSDGRYQGYYVGGLVGVSRGTVAQSFSAGNIKGKYVGGLAFNIAEGVFSNTYTSAYLEGIDSKSVKAGFAYYIDYYNSSTFGLLEYSYSVATFDNLGKNYAETYAPVRTELGMLVKRQAGYIKNSMYALTREDLIEQNFVSAFNTEFLIPKEDRKVVVSEDHIDGTDSKNFSKFISLGFKNNVWEFNVGQTPTLKSITIEN